MHCYTFKDTLDPNTLNNSVTEDFIFKKKVKATCWNKLKEI